MAILDEVAPQTGMERQLNDMAGMVEKKWVRMDPKTKEPHLAAEERILQIVSHHPATKAGGNMNAPIIELQVQRYWRNKFYETRLDVQVEQFKNNSTKKNFP